MKDKSFNLNTIQDNQDNINNELLHLNNVTDNSNNPNQNKLDMQLDETENSNLISTNNNYITFEEETEKKSDLLNTIINSMGMSSYSIKILIFGLLTCFSDGSEMVVVSLIIRKLETKWKLTPLNKAFLGGSIFNGFLLGALVSGKLMNDKGRKFTLLIGTIIFFVFALSSSFATELYSFILFRIGVGLGLGFVIPTTQTLITELSPQKNRGFNSIIIWLGFPIGEMFICYVSNLFPLDDQTYHQDNWQLIMIIAALPESPRYHLIKNNFEEAFEIINMMKKESNKNIYNDENTPIDNSVSDTLDEQTKTNLKIYYIMKKSQTSEIGYMSTLVPKLKVLTIKIWVLWFIVSYIFYGVLYLIPELLGKQKDSVKFSDLVQAVVYSTFFEIIGILSTFMIDCSSIGRLGGFKISFTLCFILCSLCMFKVRGWIICLHILKGAAQISTRALYIYTSECYSTEVRGYALGLGSSFTRLAGLLTPLMNEILLSYSTNVCFLGLSLAAFIAILISFSFKKETLNLKLE